MVNAAPLRDVEQRRIGSWGNTIESDSHSQTDTRVYEHRLQAGHLLTTLRSGSVDVPLAVEAKHRNRLND